MKMPKVKCLVEKLATAKPLVFEYANEGTVLLDGIAELSLGLQAKLLRFLTDGSFRRVGEEKEHYANVRVICASQVPLHLLVEQGKVRTDLFHRQMFLLLMCRHYANA